MLLARVAFALGDLFAVRGLDVPIPMSVAGGFPIFVFHRGLMFVGLLGLVRRRGWRFAE